MRAIVYTSTGDSSVLNLVEREEAHAGPGQVRVRIHVSGVNPTDWKRRAAQTAPATGGADDADAPAIVPNQDGAGVIDEVGDGVEGFAVGDRVWLFLAQHESDDGTAQDAAVVEAWKAVKLPDGVSFDVGASLGVPAMTAHRALTVHEDGPRRLAPGSLDGRTVLVTGGAGAVGHAAIQLARWAGATVITTISSDAKAALATAAGAHFAIDYTQGDPAAAIRELAPDGVDIVVDVDFIRNVGLVAAVVATRGSVAIYANSGSDIQIPIREWMGLNARLQFVLLYTVGDEALQAGVEDVTAAAADGALEVGDATGLPLTRFPLAETAAAHDAVESGTVGKVLIDVTAG
ncbi:NADPH:quinone reductase [Schumannella luteola]|uniref:NADPH2:quinone reductase n=1 Tax=Schumannella luteola TaxID=472059 RepID=A0A852YKP7_9MICO|nr:NADPH:quinone reductase [Schumannella luteola]NYG97775.1 NADPH2:quinone reductase [Schumannella luteola]TPW90743.1 NADPH:quinone reductase [Schumannella luteola]